jgi:probable F420-dependent oxidoreductase
MRIGIGLPAAIPGTPGSLIIEWAKRAEASGFESLGIVDRLVYPNYEPIITLAAAAAVTSKLRLISSVILAPLRNGAILAKEAATVDSLSNGRLTLGLGIGSRQDDFEAAGVDFHRRGKLFDAQLETMHRIWAQQPIAGGVIGPAPVQPGGPPILIGGYSPAATQRLARWGAGFISGGGPAETAKTGFETAREIWTQAGRPGVPQLAAGRYFALGQDARERGGHALIDYYGEYGQNIKSTMSTTRDDIQREIETFRDIGTDDIIFWPTIADLAQLDLLAEAIR